MPFSSTSALLAKTNFSRNASRARHRAVLRRALIRIPDTMSAHVRVRRRGAPRRLVPSRDASSGSRALCARRQHSTSSFLWLARCSSLELLVATCGLSYRTSRRPTYGFDGVALRSSRLVSRASIHGPSSHRTHALTSSQALRAARRGSAALVDGRCVARPRRARLPRVRSSWARAHSASPAATTVVIRVCAPLAWLAGTFFRLAAHGCLASFLCW